MVFCTCETEIETLLRVHLFPATPKQPHLAFTFRLMDWLEALVLECHVAVQDFVSAIEFLTDSKLLQVLYILLWLEYEKRISFYYRLRSESCILLIVLRSTGIIYIPACNITLSPSLLN